VTKSYSVHVRWRVVEDPRWEIETGHLDCESAEAAALFANGLGPAALAGLECDRRCIVAVLNDGVRRPCEVVGVWRLAAYAGEPFELVTDEDFEPVTLETLETLTPANRTFAPIRYCVYADGAALDVKVDLAEETGTVEVTVFDEEPAELPGLRILFA
jgi:hypothetical protein